jgi:hypothetical protein
MIQYSLLGWSAASTGLNTFWGLAPSPSSGRGWEPVPFLCLRMATEPVPETLYINQLTRLIAQEDYIETCGGCWFNSNEEVEMAIHEQLQMQEYDF